MASGELSDRCQAPGATDRAEAIVDIVAGIDPAIFGDPVARERYFRGQTYADYEGELLAAHATLTGIEEGFAPGPTAIFDHSVQESVRGMWPTYIAPPQSYRGLFLRQAFNSSQMMSDRQRAATLKSLVIVTAHPFERGNGRMARLNFALETIGHEGDEGYNLFYAHLLTRERGQELVHIHQERARLPQKYAQAAINRVIPSLPGAASINLAAGVEPARIPGPEDVRLPMEDVSDVLPYLNELHFGMPLLLQFIARTGRNVMDFIVQGEQGAVLSADKLLASLNRPEAVILVDTAHQIKADYVQQIIYCLADGETSIFGDPNEIVDVYRRPPSEDPVV